MQVHGNVTMTLRLSILRVEHAESWAVRKGTDQSPRDQSEVPKLQASLENRSLVMVRLSLGFEAVFVSVDLAFCLNRVRIYHFLGVRKPLAYFASKRAPTGLTQAWPRYVDQLRSVWSWCSTR